MRIVLVVSSLAAGGAERVVSRLANAWCDRGNQVRVLTLARASEDHYELRDGVSRDTVYRSAMRSRLLRRLSDNLLVIRGLRSQISNWKPDVVVSFVDRTNVRTLISLAGTKYPIVVSERSNPSRWRIGWHWQLLRRLLYRRADALITQTQEVRQWAMRFLAPEIVTVIPNPIAGAGELIPAMKRDHLVIALGRLSREKGFDLLLEAWALLQGDCEGWKLVILGDGPERETLTRQAEKLGLFNDITFQGVVADPETWLAKASLFVLPSRFEGFPNALLEAMVWGLPSVAFDCDSGPRDIIRDGIDGILVEPENAIKLAEALRELIRSPEARQRMADRAPDVSERFSLEKILQQWDDVLEGVSRKPTANA